ncbi:MAG: hypothetical protein JF887_14310 [Candidatus Dormibacteraeota bacterium]|uniref:Uncharacterized protein n=1 Tax=Candidatus Amunia macphersoniae TaxID=3127014 RepID=A0A934KSZ9_9BACT|nr:hypothetical protein [Candidatus Dormibacteraeota bacterium]
MSVQNLYQPGDVRFGRSGELVDNRPVDRSVGLDFSEEGQHLFLRV